MRLPLQVLAIMDELKEKLTYLSVVTSGVLEGLNSEVDILQRSAAIAFPEHPVSAFPRLRFISVQFCGRCEQARVNQSP